MLSPELTFLPLQSIYLCLLYCNFLASGSVPLLVRVRRVRSQCKSVLYYYSLFSFYLDVFSLSLYPIFLLPRTVLFSLVAFTIYDSFISRLHSTKCFFCGAVTRSICSSSVSSNYRIHGTWCETDFSIKLKYKYSNGRDEPSLFFLYFSFTVYL